MDYSAEFFSATAAGNTRVATTVKKLVDVFKPKKGKEPISVIRASVASLKGEKAAYARALFVVAVAQGATLPASVSEEDAQKIADERKRIDGRSVKSLSVVIRGTQLYAWHNSYVPVVSEDTLRGCKTVADLLAKLGNTQVTQGKEDSSNSGSGLGTLHAAQVIRKYGGEIRFSNIDTSDDIHTSESKHITGAKIDIFFKPTPTPEWFVPEIVINDETRFLVLDDDSSVVVMWKEKIRTLKLPGFTTKLETLIYVNAEKFIRENVGWVEPNDIIIIDYEIMGDRRTGLEVMHEMYYSADGKTGNHDAFLVSSHYEDPKIQEKVKSLGMKIIPKSVVHLVPFVYRPDSVKQALPESHTRPPDPNASPAAVSVKFVSQQPENGYDAVLIDDSPEIRGAWEMHQCGRKLKCYSKPQDFLADCENIHTSSGIYLDLDFGKHGKGVDFIESIYNKGFKNINIVTGYSLEHVEIPSKLRPMITNIAAKAPPWADEAGIGHIFDYF
jgi:hypothetical protein